MPKGRSRAEAPAVVARRTALVEARLEGKRYSEIYQELGYSSPGAASRDFNRALEAAIAEQRASIEVYRETELQRLDQMTLICYRVLASRHYAIAPGGRIVEDPTTGEPLPDDSIMLATLDRLLKIQDRRSKLLGLDAPQRLEVLTIDAIDAQIAELEQRLATAGSETGETEVSEGAAD